MPPDLAGQITLGGQFSSHATGGYVDSLTGVWASSPRDAAVFLNTRSHLEDDSQFISSTGLVLRKRLPGREVILGLNTYWDSLESAEGNSFNQLGIGAEILTRWIDARINYYLPESRRYELSRRHEPQLTAAIGPAFTSGAFIEREVRLTERELSLSRYESALEGLNAEAGFLVPGLDRYAEVRLLAGCYHYNNPFGRDFLGFKARLEARLLPAVIADLEYWDDAALMGGHWTAGVRVSVPFSLGNLLTLKNPFEGAAEGFSWRQRKFEERMSEMVIRSHRLQTTSSGEVQSGSSTTTRTGLAKVGVVVRKKLSPSNGSQITFGILPTSPLPGYSSDQSSEPATGGVSSGLDFGGVSIGGPSVIFRKRRINRLSG